MMAGPVQRKQDTDMRPEQMTQISVDSLLH